MIKWQHWNHALWGQWGHPMMTSLKGRCAENHGKRRKMHQHPAITTCGRSSSFSFDLFSLFHCLFNRGKCTIFILHQIRLKAHFQFLFKMCCTNSESYSCGLSIHLHLWGKFAFINVTYLNTHICQVFPCNISEMMWERFKTKAFISWIIQISLTQF